MPISDEALRKEKNSFIAVKGETTVGQAIAALQDLGGQPWWHLVVCLDDGSWGAARFSELHSSLASTARAAEVRLRGWKDLTVATAVDRNSMETRAAQALARKSPAHVLVVTVEGIPVGILVEGVTRGAGVLAASANLSDLGGKYVKLKDYGAILLSSSLDQLGGKPVNLGRYRDILLDSPKK
jgi:hypothetical protein